MKFNRWDALFLAVAGIIFVAAFLYPGFAIGQPDPIQATESTTWSQVKARDWELREPLDLLVQLDLEGFANDIPDSVFDMLVEVDPGDVWVVVETFEDNKGVEWSWKCLSVNGTTVRICIRFERVAPAIAADPMDDVIWIDGLGPVLDNQIED